MCVTMTLVDGMFWNVKTQKMTPFEVMTTFEGIVFMLIITANSYLWCLKIMKPKILQMKKEF